jgi:hypothetical protein
MRAADAATFSAVAAASATTAEAAGHVIDAETTFFEAAGAGKCAGGKPGTSQTERNDKDNHGLTQHDDLFCGCTRTTTKMM